jgi:hypothetical protein
LTRIPVVWEGWHREVSPYPGQSAIKWGKSAA